MSPSVAPRAAELPPELPFAPELPPRPGSKHPCIQNRQSYGNVTGTLEQMDAMEHCINNGCFSYPLPISKMYIPYKALADDPRMIKHVKKSESVKNEYVHKGSNRLVHDISHMGEDQLDIRIDWFVLFHNAAADGKLARGDPMLVGMKQQVSP